jgi:MscS family membrane protein
MERGMDNLETHRMKHDNAHRAKRTSLAGRICLTVWLLLLLGLVSCLPSAAPTQPLLTTSTPLAVPQVEENPDQILVSPTMAPTATPGPIGLAVEQAVASANAESTRFLGLSVEDWVNFGISLLLVFLILIFGARFFLSILKKLARKTPTPYDDLYIKSVQPYLRWFVYLIGLNIATERLQFLSPEIKHWLSLVYFSAIVGIIVMLLWKLVDIFSLWYREKAENQREKEQKEAVLLLAERAVRTVLILVGAAIVLDRLGINISALVTALGIGGLALSLAAQETIANMISGIIIMIDAPFRVGDRIEIQGLDTWGDVVDIGLRTTRIRTLDNRMVIVPNSSLSKNQVVNYTFPDPRYRTQTEIGVAYGSDLRRVREVITQSLQGIEGVIPDKPVDILFLEFGDSSMHLRVRWWIESYQDARRVTDRVNEAMYQALALAQIELPDPKMTVELKNKPAEAEHENP